MVGTLINLVQECVRLSLIKDPIWPLLSIDLALTKALKKGGAATNYQCSAKQEQGKCPVV